MSDPAVAPTALDHLPDILKGNGLERVPDNLILIDLHFIDDPVQLFLLE